ncbi:class I SAM-dependent methyltransferase [Acetivibrio cellulolyticus]|uniref:class I SAM-dependent methyltransferase n=1 Tax=Acetivibrio cellulolyticus TaxID=35830 RepID=UPI0001E2E261|nr:class I SAM-dependent methyltransferase [Acetivibrio cellulolyticus]
MSFYDEIGKYYDKIFPAGEEQLGFIEDAAGRKSVRILDVACGSGTYSIELAKRGYKITAVDLEAEMIRKVREKADNEKVDIEAFVCSMTELEGKLSQKYSVLFCIGNSIVHLSSLEEIEGALKQMYSLIESDGAVIIQIMNYDRIIRLGLKELPPIMDQEAGIEFIREYDYQSGRNVINFNTKLVVKDGNDTRTLKNTVELLPVQSDELIVLLRKAGFKRYECYGDFKCTPYKEDSYMFVLKAFKSQQ